MGQEVRDRFVKNREPQLQVLQWNCIQASEVRPQTGVVVSDIPEVKCQLSRQLVLKIEAPLLGSTSMEVTIEIIYIVVDEISTSIKNELAVWIGCRCIRPRAEEGGGLPAIRLVQTRSAVAQRSFGDAVGVTETIKHRSVVDPVSAADDGFVVQCVGEADARSKLGVIGGNERRFPRLQP